VRENFAQSLAYVLQSEGGYVDDPQDPGGATNFGITQQVYDDWRKSHGLNQQSVRDIDPNERDAIYNANYWKPISGDDLPSGVDYATFDFAVNSGVNRAARFLQKAVGVAEDGDIGPVTLNAVADVPPLILIRSLCNTRLQFLQTLPNFARFGNGWTARINDVRAQAGAMA
jgi:lysozyme family protein